jgi:O-antigen ligase
VSSTILEIQQPLRALRALRLCGEAAFLLLLVFTPLAFGAAPQWAFCISLWLALLAFAAMLVRRFWLGETLLPRSVLDLPIAILIALAAVSWFSSMYRDATLWALLRLFLYTAVFYLTLEMTESRRQTRRMAQAIVAMGLVVSFLGLVKYSGAPFPSFWKGDSPQSLTSTFVNYNHLAGYLAMIFMLGLGVVFQRTTERVLIWVGALFLVLVVLCLSMSRGAWIGSIVGVGLMLVLFMSRRGISRLKISVAAFALLLVTGITLLGSNPMIARMETLKSIPGDPSFTARTVAWDGSVEIIKNHPLLGTGLGTFPWSFTTVRPAGLIDRWREAHNDWLQIITEMGLPVLIPLIWGLIIIFKTGLHSYQITPSRLHAGAVLGALGGITAILVHSVSDFNIQITSNGIMFSVLIGLVVGRYSWAMDSRQSSVSSLESSNDSRPTTHD